MGVTYSHGSSSGRGDGCESQLSSAGSLCCTWSAEAAAYGARTVRALVGFSHKVSAAVRRGRSGRLARKGKIGWTREGEGCRDTDGSWERRDVLCWPRLGVYHARWYRRFVVVPNATHGRCKRGERRRHTRAALRSGS